MFEKIKAWLSFQKDIEQQKRSTRLLNIILPVLFWGALLYAFLAPIEPALIPKRITIITPFLLFLLYLWWMTRKGYARFAGQAVVVSLWATFTLAMVTGARYTNPAYMGYIVVVIAAGLLLGSRQIFIWALISMITNVTLIYAENVGWISGSDNQMSMESYWVAQSAYIFVVAVLLFLSLRSIDEAFAKASQEIVERKLAEEREQRQRISLEKVIRAAKRISAISDYETTFARIWESVRYDLGFDRVGIFIYNEQERKLEGVLGTDRDGNQTSITDISFSPQQDSYLHAILQQPDGLYATDNYQTLLRGAENPRMRGVRHYAAASIWASEKPLAILTTDQLMTQRPFTADDLNALRLFVGYAGLAIENAQLNTQLEQRVEERTAELRAVNKDLEAFSYSVSHDLRAPLRAITGYTRIIRLDYAAECPAAVWQFLEKINASSEKMSQLIDGLLDLSRIGRKSLQREMVDVKNLVQSVLDLYEAEIHNRAIRCTTGELPPTYADPILLLQVYSNLIGNAIKYTGKQDVAEIEIGSFEKNGQVIFYVKDNGAGFDMKYAEKLFGVFQRLHSEQEFEGTGIGLAIVQRIISRHNGKIWASAEANRGATFYFTLNSQDFE